MPKQFMIQNIHGPRAAWFGKLPGLGDFAGRRMPHAIVSDWDLWLSAGLDQLRKNDPSNWEQQFVQAPCWFFVAPALVLGKITCGVVAPSMDRVGRYYPISILALAEESDSILALDTELVQFFTAARSAIIDAQRLALTAEAMDSRLADLTWPFVSPAGQVKNSLISELLADLNAASRSYEQVHPVCLPSLPWRDLVTDKFSKTSVWWVSPTSTSTYRDLVCKGLFNQALFTQLFQKFQLSEKF